jgi:hypothetical protein
MLNELWKPINSLSNYEISNKGCLRKTGSIVNIDLYNGGKKFRKYFSELKTTKFIHIIVAETFIDNPNNCKFVKHKDGNQKNNKVDNMEWTSITDSKNHSYKYDQNEIWKSVNNFPNYEISNKGNLRNSVSKEIYSFTKFKKGYNKMLYKNDKPTGKLIHILVAEHFIDNPNNYKIIKHKDGDIYNNHINNLEWIGYFSNQINIIKKRNNKIESLDGEEWKAINDFSNYKISKLGRVSNENTNLLIKGISQPDKYLRVNLYKDKKLYAKRIHQLVAQHFIPNPNNKPIVNHKDGDKTNNKLDNLEWSTNSENIQHAHDNKLISKQSKSIIIKQIDPNTNKVIKEWDSTAQAMKDIDISRHNLGKICNDSKKFNGFIYKKEMPINNNSKIDDENWKKIKGYDNYFVSDHGRVKNDDGKILRLLNNHYEMIRLYKDNKCETLCVHKLVAKTFLDNPIDYQIVNHKDHDKKNNKLSNLEWCSHKQNIDAAVKAGKIKTDPIDQYDLDGKFIKSWESASKASKELNIGRMSIWYCLKDKAKKAHGFIWKYQ